MKTLIKIFLVFACLIFGYLILVNFVYLKNSPANKTKKVGGKEASHSGFSVVISSEDQKKAQEKRKKEEEEKQFMATYGPCKRIPILMYHHVDDKPGWLYVDKNNFISQMDYLVNKGYQTITLEEAVSYLTSSGASGKPVVITFDDGYRDFFNNAYPILRQKKLKATVFLITQLMEGDQYLTWEQAREVAGSGLITLGSHTLSHRPLASLSEDKIKDEVFSSKRIIEEKTGVMVNVFSYPFGSYNNTVIRNLKEAGFVAAVTSQVGLSCAKLPLGLRRIRVGRAPLSSYGL